MTFFDIENFEFAFKNHPRTTSYWFVCHFKQQEFVEGQEILNVDINGFVIMSKTVVELEMKPTILHIIVVGFHHKKGCQVNIKWFTKKSL